MRYLNTIDYTVIAFYFAVLVALGIYLKNRASKSLEDYLLGGRNLPWWTLGISGLAGCLDVTGTMLITSFLFMLGPRGLWVELRGGANLLMICVILWAGKWHRRSLCMTNAEWMRFRFGAGWGAHFARIATAGGKILLALCMLAYLSKGVGLFFSMFLPWSPLTCSLIIISIATLYTMASGFYGVVVTDVVQSAIILIAVAAVTVLASLKISAAPDFPALAADITGNPHWMNAFPSWQTPMPPGYEAYRSLTMFAVFYFIQQIFYGAAAGDSPHFFAAKSDRECGKLAFMWANLFFFRFALMIGFAVLGIFLVKELLPDPDILARAADLIRSSLGPIPDTRWADTTAAIGLHPDRFSPQLITGLRDLLGADWTSALQMLSANGTLNTERILPAVILHYIPLGFRGLMLAALLAASMSTFDSTVNATTGYFTRDIYQAYLKPRAGEKRLIAVSWTFVAVIVAFGLLLGTTVKSINDIWSWITAGFYGGMLAPNFLRFFWWRFNGGGFVCGTLVGLVCAVAQRLLWPDADPKIVFASLAAIGFTASIVGTFLTAPADKDLVRNFYRRTRPFGLWTPFRDELTPEEKQITAREHRNDLLALPFAAAWYLSWLMLPMLAIIRNWPAFWTALALWALGLTGMYIFWYRNLPQKNAY